MSIGCNSKTYPTTKTKQKKTKKHPRRRGAGTPRTKIEIESMSTLGDATSRDSTTTSPFVFCWIFLLHCIYFFLWSWCGFVYIFFCLSAKGYMGTWIKRRWCSKVLENCSFCVGFLTQSDKFTSKVQGIPNKLYLAGGIASIQ